MRSIYDTIEAAGVPIILDVLRNVKGLDEDGTATDREVLEGLRDYQLATAEDEGADRACHLEYARRLTLAIEALEVAHV